MDRKRIRNTINRIGFAVYHIFYVLVLIAAVVASLLAANDTHAAELGVHALTWHERAVADDAQGRPVRLRSVTPGMYYRTDAGWAAGAFSNSYGDPSAWAGAVGEAEITPRLSVAVTGGLVLGYKRQPVQVLFSPSARLLLRDGYGVRLNWLPRADRAGVNAIHLCLVKVM